MRCIYTRKYLIAHTAQCTNDDVVMYLVFAHFVLSLNLALSFTFSRHPSSFSPNEFSPMRLYGTIMYHDSGHNALVDSLAHSLVHSFVRLFVLNNDDGTENVNRIESNANKVHSTGIRHTMRTHTSQQFIVDDDSMNIV